MGMRTLFPLCILVSCASLSAGARSGALSDGSRCARQCAAEDCGAIGIRWGRYCGVTHTGCPGTSACDDYDTCCMAHDSCVTGGGLSAADQRCHDVFIKCLEDAEAAKAPTWSGACSARQIVKTMTSGIRMASAFSSMLSGAGTGGRGRREL